MKNFTIYTCVVNLIQIIIAEFCWYYYVNDLFIQRFDIIYLVLLVNILWWVLALVKYYKIPKQEKAYRVKFRMTHVLHTCVSVYSILGMIDIFILK